MDTNNEIKDQNFILIYNDTEKYPALDDVADALGISKSALRDRAYRLRKSGAPIMDRRAVQPTYAQGKFYSEWTEEDCIESLLELHNKLGKADVSRNKYRKETGVSDSTWTRYFGTFHGFKEKAGLIPTREVKALEKAVAKHASRDGMRSMVDRHDWGENYIKDNNATRWRTLLVGSDFHDKRCDLFFLRAFIDTAKRVQPDVIVLNGDIFDLTEFGKYDVDPREYDLIGSINFVHHAILKPLRNACPDTQIDLIEGNHEARLLRHLASQSQAMRIILSDLHGWTIRKLLGLDTYEVNYISAADLAAWNVNDMRNEMKKNKKIYYDCFMACHYPQARAFGYPGVSGHHHKHELWSFSSPHFGHYEWHQLGCGHVRRASYTDGDKWSNGFALIHMDIYNHQVVTEYIDIKDFAVIGGKRYIRRDKEYV